MASDDSYRKVLIISNFDLSGSNATDITLRSFFRNWPREKVLILTNSESCNKFFHTLTIKNSLIVSFRSLLSKVLLRNNKDSSVINITPGAISNANKKRISWQVKLFSIGAAYSDIIPARVSPLIQRKIQDFQPEVIYTLSGSVFINKIALKISKQLSVNVYPHFMDDWFLTKYTGSIFLYFPRLFLQQSTKRLISKAPIGFVISEKMKFEYETRFNKSFFPLLNICPLSPNTEFKSEKSIALNTIKIGYFGGLHLNRWQVLKQIEASIMNIYQNHDLSIKLFIYTSVSDKTLFSKQFNTESVEFCDFVAQNEAISIMRSFDYLVHIEAFDEFVCKFTRLSISTKIPEYLSSGVPILAIGPENLASIEYLIFNRAAYICTSNTNHEIENLIYTAITDKDQKNILQNAVNLYKKNHTEEQLEVFKSSLI